MKPDSHHLLMRPSNRLAKGIDLVDSRTGYLGTYGRSTLEQCNQMSKEAEQWMNERGILWCVDAVVGVIWHRETVEDLWRVYWHRWGSVSPPVESVSSLPDLID